MLSNLLVVLGLLAALFRGEALRGWGFRPLVGHPSISFGWGKAARPLGRQLAPLLATNHAMGEWLEDAIYSGDIPGFLRRRAKDLLRDEFLSYVEDQIERHNVEDQIEVSKD
ncbi:hypothetical protein B484DRAFT_404768 [Ochromonadaceae sp. CCMP2298]|nr:hypothetical protein B484DRAFT_404768 [Ochromonadaceae sp. CCMP2298]